MVRIGASGWIYAHWRGVFYPRELPGSRWFEHYCGVFDTVEINNTFYRLPAAEVFDAWREQAPAGFLYAVKANRFLTHMKKLKDPVEPLQRMLERMRRLGAHLGPILYQLPPRWRPDPGRLRGFCRELPRGLTHVLEFRDPGWLTEEIYGTLEEHGVALCIHDLVPGHPRRLTARTAYLRFHGTSGKYGGRYSRAQLASWAEWMRGAAAAGRDVYAYFNNDLEGHAVRDALALRELLAAP